MRLTVALCLAAACASTATDRPEPSTSATTPTSTTSPTLPTGASTTGPCTPDVVLGDTVEVDDTEDGLTHTYVLCSEGDDWLDLRGSGWYWDSSPPHIELESPSGVVVGPFASPRADDGGPQANHQSLYAALNETGAWTVRATDSRSYILTFEALAHTQEPDHEGSPLTVEVARSGDHTPAGVHLEDAADVDWIRIPRTHTSGPIEVTSPDGSPTLTLFDPTGLEVAAVAELGERPNILSHWGGNTGDHLLRVEGATDAPFVLYIRTWDETFDRGTWETEPNDSFEEAQPTPDADVRGTLEAEGDEDWFWIEGVEDAWFQMRCTSEGYGSIHKPTYQLFDGSGAEVPLTKDPEDTWGDPANVTVAPGTYRWSVTSPEGTYGNNVFYHCWVVVDTTLWFDGE